MQLLMGAWSLCGDAVDRLVARVRAFMSVLECTGVMLLFVLACLADSEDGAQLEVNRTLGLVSTALLMAAVFVPIGLTIYDFLVPVYKVPRRPMNLLSPCHLSRYHLASPRRT